MKLSSTFMSLRYYITRWISDSETYIVKVRVPYDTNDRNLKDPAVLTASNYKWLGNPRCGVGLGDEVAFGTPVNTACRRRPSL